MRRSGPTRPGRTGRVKGLRVGSQGSSPAKTSRSVPRLEGEGGVGTGLRMWSEEGPSQKS